MTAAVADLGRRAGPLLTLAALLALWQAGALLLRKDYLPDLQAILPVLWGLVRRGEIVPDLLGSLRRLAIGFGFGFAIGVPLGLVAGRSKKVDEFLAPLLGLLYPVPKAALLPLTMLWFGAGDLSKIIVIAVTVSLPLIYHAQQGAATVDEKLIWSARAMGLPPLRQFAKVILPAALPEILLGTRVAIVLGVIVMITSEMLVRQTGLGNYLFMSLDMGQYPLSYAVILVIAVLGFGLDFLFEKLRRALTRWAPERRDQPLVGGL